MKKYLILTQALYALFAVPWLGVWGLSFMGFDAGFSWPAVAIVLAIGLYPVASLISCILAWVLRKRKPRAAVWLNLVPMLWVLGIGVPVLIINFV